MNLFNEYENKNLQFIINYINQVNNMNLDSLTSEDISKFLLGGDQKLTSAEIVKALLNSNCSQSDNLNVLMENDEKMEPLLVFPMETHLPITVSKAEKAWLYYVLNDPKADLFINPGVKKVIASSLTDEEILNIKEHVYTTNCVKRKSFCAKYIKVFRTLVFLLQNEYYAEISIDNEKMDILPFKIIYHQPDDSFSIMGMSAKSNDLAIIEIEKINEAEMSTLGKYTSPERTFSDLFDYLLSLHRVKEPIVLEILSNSSDKSQNRADDRFCHLFSSFDTFTYEEETGHLISEVYYYDFQYCEVMEKILSLGKYVIVKGPQEIRTDIINILHQKDI